MIVFSSFFRLPREVFGQWLERRFSDRTPSQTLGAESGVEMSDFSQSFDGRLAFYPIQLSTG